ncbi:MAG: peptidylprolyl isomerase [Chloroflexota bacterium]
MQPGSKIQRPPRRRQHQPYRRASAVIDDRPNSKAVIFGFGRHLTNREKERIQRLLAYGVLAVVVAASVIIISTAAIWQNWVYPNQSVATVNGTGISRHDQSLMTGYFTGESTLQGTTLSQDPATLALQQLEKSLLARQAAQTIGIQVSNAQADAQLTKDIGSKNSATFQQVLSATGLSRSDYVRLVERANVLRTKVMAFLTKGNAKTAEQWNYSRIEVATNKAAVGVLQDLVLKHQTFAKEAKKVSTDTATKSLGGAVGWIRPTDTAVDTDITTFLPTLKAMAASHTQYKIIQNGGKWWVLEFLGHDKKHPLSQTQIQNDQVAAYTVFYNKFQAKSSINPPLPAGSAAVG